MGLRFGLDLGTNSLGWCVLETRPSEDADGKVGGKNHPVKLVDMGSRIISPTVSAGREPNGVDSLAANRRIARGMRRNRDRYLKRRERLMQALITHGLMPQEEAGRKALESLDPYELRAAAIEGPIPVHQLGRAIFHLNQRRGFKSNRKAEAADNESGAIKEGIRKTREAMAAAGVETFGALLAIHHARGETVRARNVGTGQKSEFDIYPARELIEDEFEKMWAEQARHHDALTEAARDDIHGAIFHQRPLRPVTPGKCSLYPHDEERASRALPLFQRYRIYEEVGLLRIQRIGGKARRLTIEQRDLLVRKLLASSKQSFQAMREKLLKLEPGETFTHEGRERDGFDGDQTAAKLSNAKKGFGTEWRRLDFATQAETVDRLLETEDEATMVVWLMERFDLDQERALNVSRMGLPSGHSRFGRRALGELLEVMQTQSEEVMDPETGELYQAPLTYNEAVERIGHHHSHRPVGELLDNLPYYGDVLTEHVVENHTAPHGTQAQRGRIPNPTVHIGLNQIRRTVNALIKAYGRPDEIVLELGRDLKLNRKEKARINKQNRENREKNEQRDRVFAEYGVAASPRNRMKLRLFEEFEKPEALCVYSGTPIPLALLFSDAIEIDHILPYSQSLDDGFNNKILCTREANREKGNKTPYRTWGEDPARWEAILERAEALGEGKQWRFAEDAMERLLGDRDFLERQLNETRYLGRVARRYMEHISNDVWVLPGRMTSMIRGFWGLEKLIAHNLQSADIDDSRTRGEKNRMDHRHHAIDAFVVACSDRGLLQKMATAAGRAEEEGLEKLLKGMPDPWEGFREELAERVRTIIVSHKPDHGRAGQLHEATALGRVKNPEAEGGYNHVVRKPFASLTKAEVGRIRDLRLRAEVEQHVYEAAGVGMKLPEALADFAQSHETYAGIQRVRLLKKEADTVEIRHGSKGQYSKSYTPGSNLFVEIFETPDGKWHGEGLSVFDANQSDEPQLKWRTEHPDARLVMRLYKGDLIRMEIDGEPQVMRVVRLAPGNGRIYAAGHKEAGNLVNRDKDPDDPFKYGLYSWSTLKRCNAHRLHVDEIGRVHRIQPKP